MWCWIRGCERGEQLADLPRDPPIATSIIANSGENVKSADGFRLTPGSSSGAAGITPPVSGPTREEKIEREQAPAPTRSLSQPCSWSGGWREGRCDVAAATPLVCGDRVRPGCETWSKWTRSTWTRTRQTAQPLTPPGPQTARRLTSRGGQGPGGRTALAIPKRPHRRPIGASAGGTVGCDAGRGRTGFQGGVTCGLADGPRG